jgi:uncharacterized membrane protein
MHDRITMGLVLLSALGAGLVGGVLFAFSNFVMRALGRLPAAQGVAAMQSINVTVVNPIFMGVLFGPALVCFVLLVVLAARQVPTACAFIFTACVLYLIGSVLVTLVCNVPMNNALATVDPVSVDAARFWARYVAVWTAWNHVRTLASIAASVCFSLALVRLPV